MTLDFYIKRSIKLSKKHSFFLFGPRQTGKSTILKEIYDSKTSIFYDLLDSEEYFRLQTDPASFKNEILAANQNIKHIIIDEIQRLPELLNQVHLLMENKKNLQFILTGSSARKLKRGQANLLAGRAWTYNLYPLTYLELKEQFDLKKALEIGTLPSVYLADSDSSAHRTLKSYTETYLEEEIKAEALVRNLRSFMLFLKLAADSNGEIINYTNISQEINVASITVKEYFQILEDTLIGFFLFPYAGSSRKQLTKHPKFYFVDTGMVRAINNKLKTGLEINTKEYGKAFEHFLIKEIIHCSKYKENDYSFSFYRTSDGAEVDLIITKPNGDELAIEIKASDKIQNSKLKGLTSFASINPKAKLICACKVPRRQSFKLSDHKVEIYPWQELFDLL